MSSSSSWPPANIETVSAYSPRDLKGALIVQIKSVDVGVVYDGYRSSFLTWHPPTYFVLPKTIIKFQSTPEHLTYDIPLGIFQFLATSYLNHHTHIASHRPIRNVRLASLEVHFQRGGWEILDKSRSMWLTLSFKNNSPQKEREPGNVHFGWHSPDQVAHASRYQMMYVLIILYKAYLYLWKYIWRPLYRLGMRCHARLRNSIIEIVIMLIKSNVQSSISMADS